MRQNINETKELLLWKYKQDWQTFSQINQNKETEEQKCKIRDEKVNITITMKSRESLGNALKTSILKWRKVEKKWVNYIYIVPSTKIKSGGFKQHK